MSFWCHCFDQNTNEFILRISALASKKRLNQKQIKALYFFLNYWTIIWLRTFFDLTSFYRLGQKLSKKIVSILVEKMTPKGPLKLYPIFAALSSFKIQFTKATNSFEYIEFCKKFQLLFNHLHNLYETAAYRKKLIHTNCWQQSFTNLQKTQYIPTYLVPGNNLAHR